MHLGTKGDEYVLVVIEARPSAHGVELAYVLRRSAWGHGYMTEAVRGVIDSALSDNSVFAGAQVYDVCTG